MSDGDDAVLCGKIVVECVDVHKMRSSFIHRQLLLANIYIYFASSAAVCFAFFFIVVVFFFLLCVLLVAGCCCLSPS